MKEIGTKPIDFTILTYLLSFPPENYHAISSIADAIGVHPRTVRSSFLRMEKKKLIRRIYRTGEANIYDITGWVDKIQAYAISDHTPTQKSVVVPTQDSHRDSAQYLVPIKSKEKKKIPSPESRGLMKCVGGGVYNKNAYPVSTIFQTDILFSAFNGRLC